MTSPFKPSVHGFPFPNWWPPGTPVIEVPTPFGTIPIGDAHGGVCGGMVFAAADYFHFQMPRPAEPEKVFQYFCRRLLESWHLPFGMLRYYDWQRRPTADKIICGVSLIDGTARLTRAFEWPRVKHHLDAGRLVPLGLVKPDTWNPLHMGRHHQVLAYTYDESPETIAIKVYDPNYPNDDTATLTLQRTGEDLLVTHSCEGPTIRGFFLTDYLPVEPNLRD